jgi:hypothetical protein
MSDVLKMDELLGKHQQMRDLGLLAGAPAPQMAAAMRQVRDPRMMKWSMIGLASLLWGVPMISLLGYGFWVAAHLAR